MKVNTNGNTYNFNEYCVKCGKTPTINNTMECEACSLGDIKKRKVYHWPSCEINEEK